MNILEKLQDSIARLSDEATELALLKSKFEQDIASLNNNIADIDIRLSQIVGAIKELDSIVKESTEEKTSLPTVVE